MSEQSSLYVNITIKKEKLEQFFQDKPVSVTIDANWLSWWDSREMYSKPELANVPVYNDSSNRAIIEEFLNDARMGAFENYDDEANTWNFGILFFSENYTEILPVLAFLKNLGNYQDKDEKGVAFIYDYFWGDESVMAYLEYADQKALFKNLSSTVDIEPVILKEANQKIEKWSEQLSN